MTRAYTVKGKKRKNKDAATKHDHEQEEEEQQIQPTPKRPNLQNDEPSAPTEESELPGIPIAPLNEKNTDKQSVIFILEKASLEVAKVGKVTCFFIELFELMYGRKQLIGYTYALL